MHEQPFRPLWGVWAIGLAFAALLGCGAVPHEETAMHPHDRPLYIISVAAELVNMHPQTLRLYERRGLVSPKRQGKNRLYSQSDIERLMYIQQLTQELGINLAGVEKIIRLQNELEEVKAAKEEELANIQNKLAQLDRLRSRTENDIRAITAAIQAETAEVGVDEAAEEDNEAADALR